MAKIALKWLRRALCEIYPKPYVEAAAAPGVNLPSSIKQLMGYDFAEDRIHTEKIIIEDDGTPVYILMLDCGIWGIPKFSMPLVDLEQKAKEFRASERKDVKNEEEVTPREQAEAEEIEAEPDGEPEIEELVEPEKEVEEGDEPELELAEEIGEVEEGE